LGSPGGRHSGAWKEDLNAGRGGGRKKINITEDCWNHSVYPALLLSEGEILYAPAGEKKGKRSEEVRIKISSCRFGLKSFDQREPERRRVPEKNQPKRKKDHSADKERKRLNAHRNVEQEW